MGLTTTQDVTLTFNANSKLQLDIGSWDEIEVQFQSLTGTCQFNSTNDSGAVQGVTDGDANLATGWQPVQGVNTANNTASTSSGAGSFIYKFTCRSKYLQLDATSGTQTASRVFINYYKIS